METLTYYGVRLKQIRKKFNLTQYDLTIILKYSNHTSISNIEKNKAQLSVDKLILLKEHLPDINVNWLLTGQGKMICDPIVQNDAENQFKKVHDDLCKISQRILNGEIIITSSNIATIETILKLHELLIDEKK